MYDLHSHLVFGVDDGCKDLETSLALLHLAEQEGILGAILTPHYMHEGRFRKQRSEILPVFEALKEEAKKSGLKIELYLGNEVFCSSSMIRLLDEGKISSMNGSKYVLVEFGFQSFQPEFDEYLYELKLSGYQPIIAHVERYQFVKERPQLVYEWIKAGYCTQMNQDSITGENGASIQKLALTLLEHNQVHIVSSDAHRIGRSMNLKAANAMVTEKFGRDYAFELFSSNALAVIQDMPMTKRKPIQIETKKSVLQKLSSFKKVKG